MKIIGLLWKVSQIVIYCGLFYLVLIHATVEMNKFNEINFVKNDIKTNYEYILQSILFLFMVFLFLSCALLSILAITPKKTTTHLKKFISDSKLMKLYGVKMIRLLFGFLILSCISFILFLIQYYINK